MSYFSAEDILSALRGETERVPRLLLVAAHPDDDILGVGGCIPALSASLHVAFVTDGAPRDPRFFSDGGFEAREDYAAKRHTEALAALRLGGVSPERIHELHEIDQESPLHMPRIARAMVELVRLVEPEGILTHAFEGGHPDHDATSFSVHAACNALRKKAGRAPVIIEFAGYHERAGERVFGEFRSNLPACTRLVLSTEARRLKERMLACHATQRAVLAEFSVEWECYRQAPDYEFTQTLGEPLYYERFDWNMSGARWRVLAKKALADLESEPPC